MNNKLEVTHIVSTDLKRPVEEIATDLELAGAIIVEILQPTKVIFLNVPKGINTTALADVRGVEAFGKNHQIHAC